MVPVSPLPLLAAPLVVLVAMLVTRGRPRLHAALNLGVALFCLGWTAALIAGEPGAVEAGGWPAPFGIRLQADPLGLLFLLVNGVVFTASALKLVDQSRAGGGATLTWITWPLLLLALNGLYLTTDFFNFYVFFELMSAGAYLLVAQGARKPLEAAWKFAVQSLLGSICLLVGTVFVYALSGSLAMDDVARRLQAGPPVVWVAPFFLFAFLLKASVFPFHWWQADAHAAATTAGSVVLAGAIINTGVYGIVRFWPLLFGDALRGLILWIGAASVVFGALSAYRTDDAKRLLGYSSTSQVGFVLMAVGWSATSAAALFFLAAHAVAKSLLFLAAGLVGDRLGTLSLGALAGRGARWSGAGHAYLLAFVSLAGLPPTAGFVGKLAVLHEGLAAADWAGVAVLVLGTLATFGYGARSYQAIFWGRPADEPGSGPLGFTRAALLLTTAGVLAGVVFGGPLWRLAERAAAAAGGIP